MKLKIFFVCMFFLSAAGESQDDVEIYPQPREDTKLGVSDFVPRLTANQPTVSAAKVLNKILWDDLKFSAFFELPSKSFYPLKPVRFPREVNFENWQVPTLDVDFLIFGNILVENSRTVVEAYLYDVKTQQQVLGKRYTVAEASLIRRIAHQFADQVVFQLSAGMSQGVARTQIAFTSLKGGNKDVYVMDYDGTNQRAITANGGLNLFPHWSTDNARIAFVSMLPNSGRWRLWLQNLEGGYKIVQTPTSYVSSPALFRSYIAFSARETGKMDPDIYVMDLGTNLRRNITNHSAIDTSPTWSPTGQQIVFISDRSGTPQLWIVDSDGSNLQRLILEGGHCDSPDWSPDGRFVAYSWQPPKQWKHDIYVLEVATGKIFQLTSGVGSHENPQWSPDGRHVVYQSSRTGSKQIFVMNADGKNRKQITAYGVNESPAWSNYFVTKQPSEPGSK